MSLIAKLRDFLAHQPALFTLSRKIIELNFITEKKIIRSTFDLQNGPKRILDIGCGTGEFAPLFKRHDYTGLDIAPQYIAFAAAVHHYAKFFVGDATKLSFADNSFDCILIMAMLHHLPTDDVHAVLTEAKRVLKPDGKILIMEDAKIDSLRNWFVKLTQKFDKGDFIRTPAEYIELISHYFVVSNQREFRSGGCTYFSVTLTKQS